jgi:intraflagellar transport protein 52
VGSPMMFSDTYIEKEDNFKIIDVILKFLTTNEVEINVIDKEDPDVSDYHFIPDSNMLSEQLKVCLQESEDVSPNLKEHVDTRLYVFDTLTVPKVNCMIRGTRLGGANLCTCRGVGV